MDIEDAFTQEVIANAGVDVGDAEEDEIRDVIRKVSKNVEVNELDHTQEGIAILCFVAGRAYQSAQPITVALTPRSLTHYLEYLEENR